MASSLKPIIQASLADGAVALGTVVKAGSDDKHATPSAAATDLHFGIAQNVASLAEDTLEVAVAGGGKGLAGGTIAKGDRLTSDGTGRLIATVTPLNKVVAIADEDAVVGDIFGVVISHGIV